jgi:hypothetical protein
MVSSLSPKRGLNVAVVANRAVLQNERVQVVRRKDNRRNGAILSGRDGVPVLTIQESVMRHRHDIAGLNTDSGHTRDRGLEHLGLGSDVTRYAEVLFSAVCFDHMCALHD